MMNMVIRPVIYRHLSGKTALDPSRHLVVHARVCVLDACSSLELARRLVIKWQ